MADHATEQNLTIKLRIKSDIHFISSAILKNVSLNSKNFTDIFIPEINSNVLDIVFGHNIKAILNVNVTKLRMHVV